MDKILILVVTLLILVWTAFFLELIPYPYGWMVLMVFFALRVNKLWNKDS